MNPGRWLLPGTPDDERGGEEAARATAPPAGLAGRRRKEPLICLNLKLGLDQGRRGRRGGGGLDNAPTAVWAESFVGPNPSRCHGDAPPM